MRYTRYRFIANRDFETNLGNLIEAGTYVYLSELKRIGSLGVYNIDQHYLGVLHNVEKTDTEYFVEKVEEMSVID